MNNIIVSWLAASGIPGAASRGECRGPPADGHARPWACAHAHAPTTHGTPAGHAPGQASFGRTTTWLPARWACFRIPWLRDTQALDSSAAVIYQHNPCSAAGSLMMESLELVNNSASLHSRGGCTGDIYEMCACVLAFSNMQHLPASSPRPLLSICHDGLASVLMP
jgi:hypothetical protein